MDPLELLARLGHAEPADPAALDRAEAEFLATASGPALPPLRRAAWRRGPARRRATWLSAATAAAGVALLAWPSVSQPSRLAPPSASGHGPRIPARTPLSRAVLIAFNAHADDILYIRKRQTGNTPVKLDRRMWLWPIQPAPGQRQRFRAQNSLPDGRLLGDWAITYPAGPADPVPASPHNCGMVVTPPRPQTGHVRGRDVSVMPHEKIWLETTLRTTRATIAPLRACLAQGHWRFVGHANINGTHTLEYTNASVPANGLQLWVDAQTYLPVRLISNFAAGSTILVDRFDYQFLPPTPANLAKLTPPIPPGYKRVHWHV